MRDARVVRKLWAYARPHLGVLGLAFVAMVVLALATGAFAFLTGPALTYLLTGGAQTLSGHRLAPWLFRRLPMGGAFIPLAIVVLAGVKGLAYLGQFYFSGLFGQRVVVDLRRALFVRLAGLSPVELSERLTGDLLSRFASDMAAVELAAVYAVASYIRDGLQLVVLVASAFLLNWRLALLSLGLAPLAVVPVSLLTRVVLKRTREAQGRLGALAAQLKEGLGALRTVQAYGAFGPERDRFNLQARAHRTALVRAAWARGVVPGVMEVLGALGIAGVLVWVSQSHAVSAEQLVSFLVVLVLVYQPAKELGRSTQFVEQASAAGERVLELLDRPATVADRPGASAARPLERAVTFEEVHHDYNGRPALTGLSLDIPVGQVTALVGPSGAGKSTVTALLLRFLRPSRGVLRLDGVDVEALTAASVRAQFALVTQEPLLFAGSVLDNLRVARPAASFEECVLAATAAQADGFIRALPQGYDTPVGERGVRLSGGQRQRLCLARALLSNAPVLVLDEATSSLDPKSEREVQAALTGLLRGRTALVIAHRLATVMRADVIHVLDGGRVVERGTHEALLAQGGTYAQLWRLQADGAKGASAA